MGRVALVEASPIGEITTAGIVGKKTDLDARVEGIVFSGAAINLMDVNRRCDLGGVSAVCGGELY